MSNSVSHAALPYPIKNARFTLAVPYLDADGDPTDPTTPDTEVSQDGGAFSDAAEEVTTISGSNGLGYITLTGAETNNSIVGVCAKVASGPKATIATLYPRVLASVGTGTLSAGSAGGGTLGTLLAYDVTGCFIQTTGGTGGGGTGGANNQARRIVTYNTSTGAFTVSPNWETTPSTDTTYSVLLPEGVTLGMLKTLNPATAGRTLVVDSAGLADANVVKIGPTGSGTAQTAANIGALLTGTGAVTFASLSVTGATAFTGNVSMAAGLNVTQSSANTSAVVITGTGSGDGMRITGGTTGSGIKTSGGATSGNGLYVIGQSATSGDGLLATSVAGVPIRGDITGNITGTVDTVTTVTGLSTTTIATAVWAKDLSAPAVAGTAADYLKDAAAMTDQFFTMTELDGAVYQFTTNALEQAPSGASAEDIADAIIAAGASLAYVGPVHTNGDVTVFQGDDYSGTDIQWNITGYPDFTGGSVEVSIYHAGETQTFAGEVVDADTLRLELTAEQLSAVTPAKYAMQVHVTLSNGENKTPKEGYFTVRKRIG